MDFINLIIKSNTLNFLIVLGLIIFGLYKLNIGKKLEKLSTEIKDYVNSSENEKNAAQKHLDTINNKIQKLPELIERVKKITDTSVKNFENKLQSDIEEEKKDIENNSKRILSLETKSFKDKLINLLSEKSVEIAKENAINQLNGNLELHNKYINKAIEELDRVNL